MRVFLIDDEQPCLDDLRWLLSNYEDIELAGIFTNPVKAMAAMENDRPDAVFLDIDMPHLNGLELSQKIQERYAGVVVIFVTAYASYALDAYKAYPLDFLLKPVPEDRLAETVSHLRRQYAELLLYLICRHGAAATRGELLDVLFEGRDDRNTLNNLYVTQSRLKTLLDCWDGGRRSIRLTEDNALAIAPGICDFTDFMTYAKGNAALSSKTALEAARVLALCRAPFLEKEAYEWAVGVWQEVETEYERIALGLAGYHSAAGRIADVEDVLCTLLAHDPLSTDGYGALLSLYMQVGNGRAFAARYEEYARMLKNDLHMKPRVVFRVHYEELMGFNKP